MPGQERTISIIIEEWDLSHPRWAELLQVIEEQGQSDWVQFSADFHHSFHLLVARQNEAIVGFLRYVVQEIGPDADCPPVLY